MDQKLIVAMLFSVSIGTALYGLFYSYVGGGGTAKRRQAALMTGVVDHKGGAAAEQVRRRKVIADSLNEVGGKNRSRSLRLEEKLAQAGVTWSPAAFYAGSAGAGLLLSVLGYMVGGDLLLALCFIPVGAWAIPRWAISFMVTRRVNQFVDSFPEALDVIIRGVRAGLPVSDCLRVIANEGQEPARSEFKVIVDALTIGMTVGEAVERLAERVPVAEASFFAIVINIQQKAGGNLSEALANLSRVLRDRKKMKGKVKSISAEAKASAGIIGSLPFLVGAAVSVLNPGYMAVLYTTTIGEICLAGGLLWMGIGVLIMRKMIQFDF
ncbi:type II secretion system F family protein [Methylocystis sp. IM2]|uniref:type II secretion system F family protein n=1 Tax=Methylocystis sp. IM2 TaxID=3136563 RepID=UPI0030FB36B6